MHIIETDIADFHIIRSLWEQLQAHNSSLHRKFFGEDLPENWPHKMHEFEKRAGECRIKFDVVKVADDIAGYCVSSINRYLQGEIVSLFVLPEFRGLGLGTCLMDAHMKWLRAHRVKSIFLYVHPCNTPAIRFYWKFNFFSNSPLMELCELKNAWGERP
ncbi:MAG: GNAT family N-acetyltransferase [Thermodesulfobacteriota bacterium]